MRSSSPFVWLAIFFVICAGLLTGPAAYAQFLFDGVTIECIEDPAIASNDSIDAPTDSLRITVHVGAQNLYADTIQVWINPAPGLGIFPTPPQTFVCGLSSGTGYPMNVVVTRGRGIVDPDDPDSAYVVGTLMVRPEGICYPNGQVVDFEVGARGVRNSNTTCVLGRQPETSSLGCVVCTGCGLLRYIENCGFAMDGIIAIGDSIWVDSLALLGFDIQQGPTIGDSVYVDMRRYTCNGPDSINYGNDTLIVAPCILENGTCGDIVQVTRKTWTRGVVGDTTWESIDVNCVRPADNVRPQISGSCIDSCAIINGNYIENDTLGGCGDVWRIYLGTTEDPPFEDTGCEGSTYTDFCGNDLTTNYDVAYVGVWFGDFMGDESVPPSVHFPHNSTEMNLLCPQDTLIWLSGRFGTMPDPGSANDLIYVDIPINDVLWDSLQKCILTSLANGDSVFVWAFDDAGNASNWVIDQCDICLDNVPPTGLTTEIYYDDAVCNKRFSPYDSSEFNRYWRNLSPDSIKWYLDKIYGHNWNFITGYDPFNVFNEPYVIGFDVRQEPDEDPNGPTGNIAAELNWLNPFAPLPQNWPIQNAQLDTFRWGYRDAFNPIATTYDSAVFVWYGKDGVDTLDPWLAPLTAPCPNGALLGITHARYMDAGGCNAILGSDHDGSTDLSEGYTTLNILHAVVDTCVPGTVLLTDTLHLNPLLPNGPAYGSIPANHTYWWNGPNGIAADPVLQFRPKRFFTQGLLDVCLIENLTYRIRVDSVVFVGTDYPYNLVGDTTWFFSDALPGGTDNNALWSPVTFDANSVNADSITFSWLHNFSIVYLPDGLYRLTLEIKDNAGNVYSDPLWIWLNGAGPDIDSVMVTQDSSVVGSDCDLNYFSGDHLCVRIETDTTADSVLVDWSCILNIDPALDSNMVTDYTQVGDSVRVWIACIVVDPSMIDTSDYGRNVYQISPFDADCQNPSDNYIINVRAFDGPTLFSEPTSGSGCDIAILGDQPCPRIVNTLDWFSFYDPDTIEVASGTLDTAFTTFGPAPHWNAISPGSVDSVGAYDSDHNWANDQVQDSVFVRLLIDAATVTPPTIVGPDTTYIDSLVLQFYNPTNGRIRELRKALFVPACDNLNGVGICLDWPNNTIYDGRIELSEGNPGLIEFRYVWLGTWFTMAGADSQMLVDWGDQDTIIVRAFTVAGDSMLADSTFLICDTLAKPLDVDNINPDFLEWTGIAPGATDPETGSTATVLNVGPDPVGCPNPGFRYEDMEPFAFDVVMSEEVHTAWPGFFPDSSGARPDGAGNWPITREWQISAINPSTQDIIIAFGDTVFVVIDSVGEEHLANDSVKYHLYGHFNLPDAWPAGYVMPNVGLVIRSAWDQAGNPARYNNPPYTDAYENDSSEDTTFFATLVGCDPWAAGCPLVYGQPDGVGNPEPIYGWIAAEEDSIIVKATIIETCELTLCAPGVYADSIHVVEGNFQTITDDPNPWVVPDSVGPWFIFTNDSGVQLGWAREYTWILRADSADLATIHCDGAYLPFTIRFDTYNNPSPPLVMTSKVFDNCVRVDVNEPRWLNNIELPFMSPWNILDSLGNVLDDSCFDPRGKMTLVAYFRDDFVDNIPCTFPFFTIPNGIGVDTSMIWGDFSNLLQNALLDSVRPDSIVQDTFSISGQGPFVFGSAFWTFDPDTMFSCLANTGAWFRLHALHDSIGHHDRELYMQDTIKFCTDCLPPYLVASSVWCDCDTMFEIIDEGTHICDVRPLQYVSPHGAVSILQCWADPDMDSSLGLDTNAVYADLSAIDPALGWTQASFVHEELPDTLLYAYWGGGQCLDDTHVNTLLDEYWLNRIYDNGDTIFMTFAVTDLSGNVDTLTLPIAIVDTLAPIVDFVYTIGDDSIRAYVSPGDQHVHVYADITGYVNDLVSNPTAVWADMSNFWCSGSDEAAWYDTVYADTVIQTGPDSFRAFWGGMSQAWEPERPRDTLRVDPDICSCNVIGAEGRYDSLYFFVSDAACNYGTAFSVYEYSVCDPLIDIPPAVPAVDSVWVMGADSCAPGWFDGNSDENIEVWAWMNWVFNELGDTVTIDSMQADLTQFGAAYAWTAWSPAPGLMGGAPVYGTVPDMSQPVPTYWTIEQDCQDNPRLVAHWIITEPDNFDCGQIVTVPVKGIRQTGLNGSHGYYMDVEYGHGESFTAEYVSSWVRGDFTWATGFPGDPDHNHVDSVLVLQNSVYALDWDSVMTVSLIMCNNCTNAPGDTVYDWSGTWIDFTGFLNDPIQYPDVVYYNYNGNHCDSLIWTIPLYDGGPAFNTNILSNRYWYGYHLSGVSCGFPEQFCNDADLDSVVSFTIQNWNTPNPGMTLICDSLTTVCNPELGDTLNMALWNQENPFNGVSSPDTQMENLYKVYTGGLVVDLNSWAWYSHEDVNNTRFFVFVEDTVLQCDGIDNDNDGSTDEIGEGVDFYTADLRINTMPQVAHVDSMNVNGVTINYLWYADNFSEHQYDVSLFISDIYGHRDTLACGETALTFYEDETCPFGDEFSLFFDGAPVMVRIDNTLTGVVDPQDLTADDSLFVFSNFDSISFWINDPRILDEAQPGSGVDLSIDTTPDSSQFNGANASTIRLLDSGMNPVAGFTQTFYGPYDYFDQGPLTLSRTTSDTLPDGRYTIEITTLDRMGNSCTFTWSFILDQTCPDIDEAYTARPGTIDHVSDLFTSWDYVEIRTHIADALDGVDSVWFDYAFDANRDGNLDAYPYWQKVNILTDEGGAWDTEFPFVAYWNIRNLPWSSEDTLGLPPVRPDSCVNRYFVRVQAQDIYGHRCEQIFPVDVTDDIGPVAAVYRFQSYPFTYGPGEGPQSSVVACFNPNTMTDSTMYVCAQDWIDPDLLYDPLPGDSFTNATRWFDAYNGLMQYKFFEAPNFYDPGNRNPSTGWVVVHTGRFSNGQDTIVARDDWSQDWCAELNMAELTRNMEAVGQTAHQFNLRFVAFDVCGNSDALNTPVITFRVECDLTSPLAVICFPEPDMCVTNYRCDSSVWVPVQAVVPIFEDVDSIAFFLVDSLSVPGLGIHTFIGGDSDPDSTTPQFSYVYSTRLNTNNMISGYYWVYAVAYDSNGLFDTAPIWQRILVDNTPAMVTSCWIGNGDDDFNVIGNTVEDSTFALRAFASDPIGCGVTGVQFQYLDRWGNWRNLETDTNINEFYGADMRVGTDYYGYNGQTFDTQPDAAGYYEVWVTVSNFGNSPIDSSRFRAYAVDDVDWGDNNVQGDANRDCMIDRDLACGTDICCMAIQIRDQLPTGTVMHCYNHAWFQWALPQFDAPTTPIVPGDHFSTCNYQNPLDTLLLVARIDTLIQDGWLMHFKFWRSSGEFPTDTMYVPNDQSLNPAIPALGPIALESTWDSVYVVWTGARAFIDSADNAVGLQYSTWCFAAYLTDVTGNAEPIWDDNMCCLSFACIPQAPITDVSYVTNDPNNPDNRIRVTEAVPYQDFVTDTIEVIYNRTTDPGSNDPEALVIFYTDADAIRNCHGVNNWEFNLQLWDLDNHVVAGHVCPVNPAENFAFLHNGDGYDQWPPDDNGNGRYAVGLYLDNSYGPGVYNFAMLVRDWNDFNEGDANLDGNLEGDDSTRIDLVVRVVNVNEPQVVFCYPQYGDVCGAHNTVPLSANDVSEPSYFSGTIDTVWFQSSVDGVNWSPITDPVTGRTYDLPDGYATVKFELDEHEVPGMAGWYYERHSNPQYSWYAERDLFPDVAVYIWETGAMVDMNRQPDGMWTTATTLTTTSDDTCYHYSYVIDANDNGTFDGPEVDRWIDDPRDACTEEFCGQVGLEVGDTAPCSQLCLCEYMINFPSTEYADGSYLFRTVVSWHDDVAYHVIENPAPGDSLHMFFVHNVEPTATHDIEFDITRLNGGLCDTADVVHFVTDIQPYNTNGDLIVEDICMVIYQVSLTDNPFADSSWVNVDTVLSNSDSGWTEGWPGSWTAYNPIADNIDNDGDGLVDETHDVQAGNGIGEENSKFWSRSVIRDMCGNTYVTNAESIWVDVSEPAACITQVGDVAPADNQVVIIPLDRDLSIIATDQSYADPGKVAVFQYRLLNPIGPWTNIEADTLSNDTVRHVGNTYTAVWDLYAYYLAHGNADPENWYQLRAIAIDTVNNSDLCDNVVCQITIRLNDNQPASRVQVYTIVSDSDSAASCTGEDTWYIMPSAPYCIRAIFAPTNIDTGLASLTFQYETISGGDTSEWRNIETIYDPINHGLNGDTTACVWFQPRPEEIGEIGFNIRVLVEDYNGNDTSDVVTLYADGSAPAGSGMAVPTINTVTDCGNRCVFNTDSAMVSVTFLPDDVSHEVNVDSVWMTAIRNDNTNSVNFGNLTRLDDDTWTFDFGGDLCAYWVNHQIDMGCFTFTLHFNDCAGNVGEMEVTTDCGFGETSLVCVDCPIAPPDHASLDNMSYQGWDCTVGDDVTITDEILDGTTEIGNQTVEICGALPEYQQHVACVRLYVESTDAGVPATLVDSVCWQNTYQSAGASYCFHWNVAATDTAGNLLFPSGYYRVWVLAVDAICQLQDAAMADQFFVHVDNAAPTGVITQINGHAPNPAGADTLEFHAGEDDPATFWVDWYDGLNPDDSTQTHNQVELWAKDAWHPNQADAWTQVGSVPSPCNPHFILFDGDYSCGDTLHIVAIVTDRWENGDLDVERAMAAYDSGLFVDVIIIDTTPPSVELWSIGPTNNPADSTTVPFDQQNHIADINGGWDNDVYLTAFGAAGDRSIRRVYFQYSPDCATWFDIGVDEDSDRPPCCEDMNDPLPWWCEFSECDGGDRSSRSIMWSQLWDISGLQGDVCVRVWAEDACGNVSDTTQYVVSIDVSAPMAKVFVWPAENTNIQNIPCPQWDPSTEIADTLQRYTVLTVGACPDTANYDAYGVIWFIKRANDHPLSYLSWCQLADDSTGPFSYDHLNLWGGTECPEPVPGDWYDIAALTTDQNHNELTWTQFLNHGQGLTWEDKWAWLMANGYVKRFQVVDHVAPVAHSLMVTPDCTPDSSVMFVHGNVHLSATVDDQDVVAVTFAVREAGSNGPWTVIERVEGTPGEFHQSECNWNTELLNGTYVIGAFAEDGFGNIDGDLSGVGAGPTNTLTVNVDNQPASATITSVMRDGVPVTTLERGSVVTFAVEATDNFGVTQVALFYRPQGGDGSWILAVTDGVNPDPNFPYSFNWLVPPDLVDGWTYEFQAVAYDFCGQNDSEDAQGQAIVDGAWQVVDHEANIAIVTIGGQDAATVPHLSGDHIAIVAHSEPQLDHVRFIWIRGADTTEIETLVGSLGQTVWTVNNWDVTTIAEGPAQMCAIGSADQGGNLVTLATDCRNVIIDHTVNAPLAASFPPSHGLMGGDSCSFGGNGSDPEDVWIRFAPDADAGIDSVWFDWKWTADPNDELYWHTFGLAIHDQLSGRWAYPSPSVNCGIVTFRARVSDNSVPESNVAFVIFADTVRLDNCPPNVDITNINGDVTPDNTEIAQGQVATIVATVTDAFGQGGNSAIDSVAFYYHETGEGYYDWIFIGGDGNGEPWETQWNTGGVPFGSYEVIAVAWDEAGNCAENSVTVNIIDQLYQRAWIVGYDVDNGLGCVDHIWAVTDDCPPNYTTHVMFQYTTDNGQSWVNLGEDLDGHGYCDEELDYNIWGVDLEFDAIPVGAIYRAVATDESNNLDPNPPQFRFSDVSNSAEPVVTHQDWVRVPVTNGQVPWVFSTLEDYTEQSQCHVDNALVCVQPVNGDPLHYAGPVPSGTSPCRLDGRDGQLTIFRGVPVTQGNFTFMLLTKFELNIHQVTTQGGSNGWLTSEDNQLQLFIPPNGAIGTGTEWFEPTWYDSAVNLIPPSQYYYTLISEVENVMSHDLGNGTVNSHFRMHFNPALVPPQHQDWQVVAAYWDSSAQIWSEVGIVYEARNFTTGQIDFQWLADWNVSTGSGEGCPNTARMAVFLTSAQPLSQNVHFGPTEPCAYYPDSTYYTVDRGPTTDCHPIMSATLRQGEYVPPLSSIDVYLDGIRIVNDGEPDPQHGHWGDHDLFDVSYDNISGIFMVQFDPDQNDSPPWFGCLSPGQHHVQIYVDNQSTTNTPFFVDVTAPEAFTSPGYVNHQITLWADLTDLESGVDTNNVELDVFNCDYFGGDEFVEIHQDAMTFTPIAHGYHAAVQIQWEAIQHLWHHGDNDPCVNPQSMCVEWEFVGNKVCLNNEDDGSETEYYTYAIDVEPPTVTAISPIGAPIDDDGDGIANEDWRDCQNNDNDFWWSDSCDCWMPRYDEDPINFVADTFNCGERLTISAAINDLVMCCSGASQVNMRNFQLWIDGVVFSQADTSNHALNFHIFQQFGNDDAVFTWGGPSAGTAADFAYTPGQHQIIVNAADSVGNVGSQGFAWTYYVRCAGPAVEFEPTDCGVWFNPEGSNNQFGFSVETTSNMPIAPNGITYEVRTVPEGERISGPTTIDPNGQDSVHVNYFLGGSFPDGQQGIELIVNTWNNTYVPEVDTLNGITHSRMTFWADNCAPTCVTSTPADQDSFSRDEAIVVEVFFTDDCAGTQGPNSIGQPGESAIDSRTPTATITVGRQDSKGNIIPISKSMVDVPQSRDQRGRHPLDDNGSGISLECFDMNIIAPNGDNIGPENNGDYTELDAAHAKFIVPSGQNPGNYTVNVTLCDCVGNLGGCTWHFNVSSVAPSVAFCPIENDSCSYDGYWNPDLPLHLCATIRETDNVNTNLSGIRVDVLRVYNCESGLCTDTLLAHAEYNISEQPDPNNLNQVFTISGDYNFDHNLAATELRIVVSATNLLGQTATRTQAWIVDSTPPTISIVSPLPNSVVSNAQAVVISANFSDATFDSSAAFRKNGTTDGKRGAGRLDSDDNGRGGSSRGTLGSWKSHVAGGRLDDLDGDSGVDPSCIELILIPLNGGAPQNLTDAAVITNNNITWVGNLDEGGYTVVLSVCDRVCNTSSINWNFTVTSGQPCFIFADPCYVSNPQHTFVFRRSCENVDLSSLRLTIEGQDSTGSYLTIISGAPVQSAGDSSWYAANIPNLADFSALRLTLVGNFNGGAPLPTVTHVCVVDVFGPSITSVSPNPADTLWIVDGHSPTPTFIMTFVEVGNTSLDGPATRLWLTLNGEVVATDPQVTIDPAMTSGTATLQAPALGEGDYILSAYVADIAGNSTTMSWTYKVWPLIVPEPFGLGVEAPWVYPNPFGPSVTDEGGETAKFHLSFTGNVGVATLEIKIYDFSGRFVATVWDGSYTPNSGVPEWKGVNESGDQVANGVYLAHVKVSAGGQTREDILKVAFKNQQK